MKKCLFSVSYAGFWGQDRLELLDFITKAGELGYEAVMIAGKRPHLSPLDATPERLESVRQRACRTGRYRHRGALSILREGQLRDRHTARELFGFGQCCKGSTENPQWRRMTAFRRPVGSLTQ